MKIFLFFILIILTSANYLDCIDHLKYFDDCAEVHQGSHGCVSHKELYMRDCNNCFDINYDNCHEIDKNEIINLDENFKSYQIINPLKCFETGFIYSFGTIINEKYLKILISFPYRSNTSLISTCYNEINKCNINIDNLKSYRHSAYNKYQTPDIVQNGLMFNLYILNEISSKYDINFIIMHGSLIGKFWNDSILPWDDDLDVSIVDTDILKLEKLIHSLNVTNKYYIYEHKNDEFIEYYDLNDDFIIYRDKNPKHHIEARIIHIHTGVYTDITYLHNENKKSILYKKSVSYPKNRNPPFLVMKANYNNLYGGHIYSKSDIIPLQDCYINSFKFKCPNNIENVLRQNYHKFDKSYYKDIKFDIGSNCFRN